MTDMTVQRHDIVKMIVKLQVRIQKASLLKVVNFAGGSDDRYGT